MDMNRKYSNIISFILTTYPFQDPDILSNY
jgi:hypothetical protein